MKAALKSSIEFELLPSIQTTAVLRYKASPGEGSSSRGENGKKASGRLDMDVKLEYARVCGTSAHVFFSGAPRR
jgi:hypothetical protein